MLEASAPEEGRQPSPLLEPAESDPTSAPLPGWPWWTALTVIVGALLLTVAGSLVIDLPAIALGVNVTSSHTPAGLTIADTFVQDLAFVVASVYCVRLAGFRPRAWMFGIRTPGVGWRSAVGMIVLLLVAFILLDAVWAELVNPSREKLLEQLGSNEGTALLVLSATLTCVVAPMCEEFLFRGCIFTALRRFGTLPAALITGLLFGAVHATSAPGADLLPLGALGFGLCLLYRYSGSLYPGMAAHSLNNCLAFASLEGWIWWKYGALLLAAMTGIGAVIAAGKRIGLIPATTGSTAPAA